MEKIVHKISGKNQIINGVVPIYIKNNEYINLYPFLEHECDWIEIVDKNINFDMDRVSNIRYKIDGGKIKSAFERAVIILDEKEDKKAEIDVFKVPDFNALIDKYFFSYNDGGKIKIKNNGGESIEIYPFASEGFIKFGEIKKSDASIEIPFAVKVPLLLKKQTEIYGKPYITAEIGFKFIKNGKEKSKAFKITVGSSFED